MGDVTRTGTCQACGASITEPGAPCTRCGQVGSAVPGARPLWGTPPESPAAGPPAAGHHGLPPLAAPGPLPPYGPSPGSSPHVRAPHGTPPGYAPYAPYAAYPASAAPPKSAALAMLLSWLWLGAGHLYLGRIGMGILLAGLCFLCLILDLTIIGALVGIPLWLAGFVFCLISCSVEGRRQRAWSAPN